LSDDSEPRRNSAIGVTCGMGLPHQYWQQPPSTRDGSMLEQLITRDSSFSDLSVVTIGELTMIKKSRMRTAATWLAPIPILLSASIALAQDPGFDTLSDPLSDVTAEELADFDAGLEVFERGFGPPQGGGGPGVGGGGPMRNTFGANSCVSCHGQARNPTTGALDPGKDGGASVAFRAIQATAYDEAYGTCDHLEDRGGPGFQANTLNLAAGPLIYNKRGQEVAHILDFPNGEYIPLYSEHGVPVGPSDDRTTNDLFGLGLLDAVEDSLLEKLADPYDADGDGISGRIHWVTDHHGDVHAGKFGRKSEVAHLDEFNAEAFQNEQGVTNPEFPSDGVLVVCDNPADPLEPSGACLDDLVNLSTVNLQDGFGPPVLDVNQEDLDLVNAYVRFLAQPLPNTDAMDPYSLDRAKHKFRSAGCATCHTPKMKTGYHESASLSYKVIEPYSDLLLHDMGSELGEGCKGDATPNEWRTEPLWGLRFVPGLYMHDGRATTLYDAIQMHGGEAALSRYKFNSMEQKDQDLVIEFLNTL